MTDDFEVIADRPSSVLYTTTVTFREQFCTANSTSFFCPDGATLRPMSMNPTQTITPMIANGVDRYDFTLKLRDRYGNEVKEGSIKIEYTDRVRVLQVNPLDYMNLSDTGNCLL